ncbi:MAG: alpha/beta fold hydrolase, partial [Chloroflexi bacterium]|nr:alpha/beta fold hydrolase [Chloroflexota bacterium]
VVAFNHGYIPPREYRPTERYLAYVDAFARNGYIVLRPDYRGHGDSEGEPTSIFASPGYTVDVLNAVAAIQRFPDADPQRIGMWGHSMGGQITLRAMVVSAEIKAGVIWAGMVAPQGYMTLHWRTRAASRPTPTPDGYPVRGRWGEELTSLYGTPEQNPAFWDAVSPNAYLGDLSGPIQIHHGAADESVPLAYSQALAEGLRAAGQAFEFHVYEGDDHNISRNWGMAMTRSVAFLDRHLKGAS